MANGEFRALRARGHSVLSVNKPKGIVWLSEVMVLAGNYCGYRMEVMCTLDPTVYKTTRDFHDPDVALVARQLESDKWVEEGYFVVLNPVDPIPGSFRVMGDD